MLLVEQLRQELAEVKEELRLTKEELFITKEELRVVKEENGRLKQQMSELAHRKGSHNSSLPPSMDLYRNTKSLRQQSNKRSGGQTGHEGKTLSFSSAPNEVIEHIATYCTNCGSA